MKAFHYVTESIGNDVLIKSDMVDGIVYHKVEQNKIYFRVYC